MERVSKNIKKAIDGFLSENADVFGVAFVLDVILSKDHREARVFVHFENDSTERKRLLEEKKREISKAVNEHILLKYPPRIKIEGVDDETVSL